MIRTFPVGLTYLTIELAKAAAAAHLLLMQAEPGSLWNGATVREQWLHLAAGIELGVLPPPATPCPVGASDIIFDGAYWNAPPT